MAPVWIGLQQDLSTGTAVEREQTARMAMFVLGFCRLYERRLLLARYTASRKGSENNICHMCNNRFTLRWDAWGKWNGPFALPARRYVHNMPPLHRSTTFPICGELFQWVRICHSLHAVESNTVLQKTDITNSASRDLSSCLIFRHCNAAWVQSLDCSIMFLCFIGYLDTSQRMPDGEEAFFSHVTIL